MKNHESAIIKSNDLQIIKISVVLIISALTIFSVININTYMSGILDTQNEIKLRSNELQIKNLALDNYNNNKTLENSLKNSISAIKEKINPYPAIQHDIIKLDSIMLNNNLTVTDFRTGNVEILNYITESQTDHAVYYSTISLTAHGNYYDILSAYNEITTNERWYDIKSFNLTSKDMQGDMISIDTVFNIYFMEKTLPSSEKIESDNIYKNENPFRY